MSNDNESFPRLRWSRNTQQPERPHHRRSLSDALRLMRTREEQDNLLGDDERVDTEEGHVQGPEQIFCPNPHAELPVYTTLHRIRRLVMASIDDPYSFEQLKEPRMNVLIVRPLVDRLYDPEDVSVVYCLLVNKVQFLREQTSQTHHETVSITRATLCEIVASKILRRIDEEHSGRPGLLLLANVLVASFEPFQQAPDEVLSESGHHSRRTKRNRRGGYEGTLTALEVAIISKSKFFLSGSACRKVVDAVYRGRVVYTPTSFMDILPDYYKHKPVSLYDPRKAPIFNQYRLIVPRTRNLIEIFQFLILFILYGIAMHYRDHTQWTAPEVLFIVYAAGWVLDELLSILEHGWDVHTQNLWSFLDISFCVIYITYLTVRIHGWAVGNMEQCRQALDLLSIASILLFPRIAFNVVPDNMLFLSLRAMMADFTVLTLLAVWCFAGFLLAMRWLAAGRAFDVSDDDTNPITISKWMLFIWFGLDGTGIQQAPTFHLILGPALMVLFAFLGNTLFLTVLVAILTNTFSKIAADASAEIQFRRAVQTFEGVKSDSLFLYRPPFNILALVILLPLKFILSPRWFHKINVFSVKALNFPILLFIALHERRSLWTRKKATVSGGPNKKKRLSLSNLTQGFDVHGDLKAVFEADPPTSVLDAIEEEDDLDEAILENSFAHGPRHGDSLSTRGVSVSPGAYSGSPGSGGRRRRFSSVVTAAQVT
ncbi:hypothetical protein EJ05DRAFT_461371 [Pseudovirgaria hyperparasitica]|uniref:Nonselective cation channel n=1 Tax=Pseudovirgaria hyperparasitica TaxID=470096 RepID=A0A6A6WI25_9PEZI|nr:uncharacterized protein EJ05DRAFT_461371 [Pseudovirgaria hyperparasitica]KAF2760801.1 hypothetical protein EJ05DRAFT_461371 [Pseudovirgaria hyperparasitica]